MTVFAATRARAEHDPAPSQPLRAPEAPLRVALFSGNYNCVRDGANQALNRLVGYLTDTAGAQVRVYSPTIANPAFTATGTLVSVPSIAIPGRPEYRLALGLPKAIRHDIRRFQPDIVHLSAPDLLGRAAQRFARTLAVPVVTSLHTRFETYFEHYRLGFLKPYAEAYLRRFYAASDRILVPNQAIAAEFRAQGLDHVSPWGRGVDRAVFHPSNRDPEWRRRRGYADDDIVVLFFGRLVREKGLDIFAEIVEAARARGHRLRPMIVGDGPARDLFAHWLPDADFLGHLSGAALGRAVASADILINPSITEAFGNVTLEAMAAGLAIVAADVPSACSLIDPGENGLLVPPIDVDGYVAAVERLILSPECRRALGGAASEAANRFSWDDVSRDVLSAYRASLRAPPRSGEHVA
ncbi:glycosyltransferase family 4 protein [Hephaestia sp. GCM10023244]|uniref:glycosyltransferase family 4 protein n=1 Tax=unclassified Hephaestia TaxID=2631281 RepID=UPI0020774030|nr:glycosyltransferase family 1 protein [Hephaestia sp. MAHUQ-44]MCM8730079.1 glycosyltransferase family 1 protein [Hephaestia sp. MAHUQ-44]